MAWIRAWIVWCAFWFGYDVYRRSLWSIGLGAAFVFYVGAEIYERRRRKSEWDSLERLLRSGKYLSPLPSSFRRGRLTQERRLAYLSLAASQSRLQQVSEVEWPQIAGESRDEPVIGYRVWHILDGRLALHSLAMAYTWSFEINRAVCMPNSKIPRHSSKAPHEACECGLYVQATVERTTGTVASFPAGRFGRLDQIVVGSVMGWGRVCQHEHYGWRAEFARPIALYGRPGSWADRVAKIGGIPCFENLEGLKYYTEEYGKSLPGQGVKKEV